MANPKDSMRHSVMLAALQQIVALAPAEAPEEDEYDDTESAYSNGMDVGLWTAAEAARKALDALGLPHKAVPR